ncbi:MAG TPA: hypothetical protein VF648_00580 [Pyrinomonadaceae bacterium]|jgi:hypothetical protein
MNPEDFLSELKGLTDRLDAGKSAAKAAGTPAIEDDNGLEITSKSVSPETTKQSFVDPLRKCFDELGGTHKGFAALNTQAAQDDPYSFIRRKGANGFGYAVTNSQLGGMIAALLQKGARKEGVTLDDFLSHSGQKAAMETSLEGALSKGAFGEMGGMIEKALTSGGGSGGPLVRTDLEALCREAYLRNFPALEAISNIPANGLTHSYNVKTATGAAVTVSELGDLAGADADSGFVRRTNSNIATIASRRGISLKLQYASQQSGMNYGLSGPENTEVISAITAISNKNQSLMLQGNYSTAAKVLADEEGATDANGYDGLRTLLKAAGTSITLGEGEKFYDLIDRAVGQIMNAGGDVNSIMGLMSVGGKRLLNTELLQFMRRMNSDAGATDLNIGGSGLMTVAETVAKMLAIPASAQTQGVGHYVKDSVATEDAFIIDPNGAAMAYLGSANPVILELPVGFNNALSNVYIVFLMNGLVLYIDGFHRKIRIPKQTV